MIAKLQQKGSIDVFEYETTHYYLEAAITILEFSQQELIKEKKDTLVSGFAS